MSAIKEIQKQLLLKSNAEALAASRKFVPGTMKVYGVRTPELEIIAKQYKNEGFGFGLIKELWDAGALEEKLIAVKILQKIAKKDAPQSLKLVEYFAPSIDNWAVCDAVGMQGLKTIVPTHKNEIFALAKKLNTSKNFWERRLSLVLVEYYTRYKECHPAIIQLIKPLESDTEYYVKKAITWIRKNFEKGK